MRFALRTSVLLQLLLSGICSSICHAQTTNAGSPNSPLPPVLNRVLGVGAHATYLGQVDGLQGYLLTNKRPDGSVIAMPAYITPDGNHLILGRSHSEDGTDDTSKQEDRLALRLEEVQANGEPTPPLDIDPTTSVTGSPGPNYAGSEILNAAQIDIETGKAEDFAAAIHRNTANFNIGSPNAAKAYLVGDDNCTNCEAQNDMLRALVGQGKLNLTVVPAGLTQSTELSALTLLDQIQIAKAWYTNSLDANQHAHDPSQLAAWLTANNSFAVANGATNGPILAYINKAGLWTISTTQSATPPDLPSATQ